VPDLPVAEAVGAAESAALVARTRAWDCYTSSAGYVLAALGYEHRVLGAEWGYRRPDPDTEIADPSHRVVLPRRTRRGIGELVFFWHGVSERIDRHATPEAAVVHVSRELASGLPVVLRLDSFHVPHATQFRRMHHPHRLVAAASSSDGGIRLADPYQGSVFDGWVPGEAVLRALDCAEVHPFDGFGEATVTFALRPTAPPRAPDRETVRAEIAANLDGYFRGAAGAEPGREVVRAFVESLVSLGREQRLSPMTGLLLATFFGECGSQRTQNARFLEVAETAVPGAAAHAAAFDALAGEWLAVRHLFFVAHARGRDVAAYLPGLLGRLRALIRSEAEVFGAVDRCRASGRQ
jgi:hypothetical protein